MEPVVCASSIARFKSHQCSGGWFYMISLNHRSLVLDLPRDQRAGHAEAKRWQISVTELSTPQKNILQAHAARDAI